MYDILKDIVNKKAHLNNFHMSGHNNKNCFSIKESGLDAKCKHVNLVGFESINTTFAFELDSKNIKCGQNTKISPYFEDKKGLDKGNDGIIFTTINNKKYVFVCELKDNAKGHIAQFRSTSCFIDYLKSILKRFHNIDTNDLSFKYIVFSKHGTTTKNTNGSYISRNQDGFEVFNMKCCDKVEYYIESFL